ncbi:MAG: hypothetical protein ACXAC8_16170 [Candidatus Hodarchaeales archaeon]|jgi:transcription initiation factor IIE alpha subunit
MLTKIVNSKNLVKIMPPSAQKVYQTLEECNKLSSNDLVKKTRYSPRMVRYALRQLKDAQLIVQLTDMADTRRCYYALRANF